MKKVIVHEIEHRVTNDKKDRRTWEKRIDNCIKARDDAEDLESKAIWTHALKSVLRLAVKKSTIIN